MWPQPALLNNSHMKASEISLPLCILCEMNGWHYPHVIDRKEEHKEKYLLNTGTQYVFFRQIRTLSKPWRYFYLWLHSHTSIVSHPSNILAPLYQVLQALHQIRQKFCEMHLLVSCDADLSYLRVKSMSYFSPCPWQPQFCENCAPYLSKDFVAIWLTQYSSHLFLEDKSLLKWVTSAC